MKKTVTLLSLILVLGFNIKSQTLNNTTWTVSDGSGVFLSYFSFNNDTISSSADNIIYTPFAHLIENGNTCYVIDFPGGTCLTSDTGKYYFSIYNDTLHFVLINDNCSDRSDVVLNYHWASITTGIAMANTSTDFEIFPNPFNDFIKIKSNTNKSLEIILYDISSRKILQKQFTNTLSQNVESLSKGIYLYEIRNRNGTIKKGKLIKE